MLGKDLYSLQSVYKDGVLYIILGDPRHFLGLDCKLPAQLNSHSTVCVRLSISTGLWVKETLKTGGALKGHRKDLEAL